MIKNEQHESLVKDINKVVDSDKAVKHLESVGDRVASMLRLNGFGSVSDNSGLKSVHFYHNNVPVKLVMMPYVFGYKCRIEVAGKSVKINSTRDLKDLSKYIRRNKIFNFDLVRAKEFLISNLESKKYGVVTTYLNNMKNALVVELRTLNENALILQVSFGMNSAKIVYPDSYMKSCFNRNYGQITESYLSFEKLNYSDYVTQYNLHKDLIAKVERILKIKRSQISNIGLECSREQLICG